MGHISTLHPVYSPMLWTSIATGKRPYKHGVLGFSEPLPDGSGVLYVDHRSGSRLMFHDRRTDTSYAILEESSEGQYVATGHIVYAHPNGGLFAIRFDRDRRTTVGVPAPLLSDLQPNGSVAAFRVAPSGALVYRAGLDPEARIMVWRHGGRVDTLPLAPRILSYARFSPDGRSSRSRSDPPAESTVTPRYTT